MSKRRGGQRCAGHCSPSPTSARVGVALGVPRAAGPRDLRARPAGQADRPVLEPGRDRRADRQPEDDADRAGADPAVRDADRLPARDPPLPGPVALRDARRAAARAAAGGRRDRPAGRVRPLRPARLDVRAPSGSRSRSPRPRSRSRSRSSRARSTSARRSPPSRRSTRTSSPRRARSAPARPHVLPRRAAARARRPGCRRGARVRARPRRVRRDDHVRRQPPG